MTAASSHILSWPPQDAEHGVESDSTLALAPGEFPYVVVPADATDYVTLLTEQCDEYAPHGDELLGEVIERIERLEPIEVDGGTQKLLDAAVKHQQTGPCDDVEGWASRLVDDVKDADD